MGEREESVARAFVSAWCGEEYGEAEIDRQLDFLSDDIRFHVYAWERPVVGPDAVREELMRQTEMGIGGIRSEILTMASVDNTVFLERTDWMTFRGKPFTMHVAAVGEVNAEGKISAWREYYDSRELSVKLGTDAGTPGSRGYDT